MTPIHSSRPGAFPRSGRLSLLAAVAAAGCASLIGFPDYGPGGAGTGGAGTSSTGGAGTGGASTSTGGGGTGGSSPACRDGDACYYGLDGTEGIGSCKAGTLSCEGGVGHCNDVRPKVQKCAGAHPDDNCDGIADCTGATRWAVGTLTEAADAVAAGVDGTVAVAGATLPKMDNGYVATFDARGRPCWGPKAFGGAGSVTVLGVALTGGARAPDGSPAQAVCDGSPASIGIAATTVVTGSASGTVDFGNGPQVVSATSDAFVAAFDTTGKLLWVQLFGSAQNNAAEGVAAGPDGTVYVTGNVQGAATIMGCPAIPASATGPTTFVAALAPATGACTWLKTFTGNVAGTGVAARLDGSIVAVGRYFGTVDFGGNVTLPSGPAVMNNTYIVGLAHDGSIAQGPVGIDVHNTDDPKVAVGPAGAVILAGTTDSGVGVGSTVACQMQAGTQAYLVHVDNMFATPPTVSCYSGNGAMGVKAFGVAVDLNADILLGLWSDGTIDAPGVATPVAGGAFVVLKIAGGTTFWSQSFGPSTAGYATGIAVDGMGDAVVAANVNTAVDVHGATLPANQASVLELGP